MDESDWADFFANHRELCTANKVVVMDRPDGRFVGLFLSLNQDQLQVLAWSRIGPRNGISLYVVVHDPAPSILTDRIVAMGRPVAMGWPFEIRSWRGEAYRQRRDALEVVQEKLEKILSDALSNPDKYERDFRSLQVESRSISTCSGGAPELGKR